MRGPFPLKKTALSALFLALCLVLPFLTAQLPALGSMLLPMHLPVFLCGYVCGWQYGLAVGLSAPILRSLTLSMPPFFPTALCMALELGVYGASCALLCRVLRRRRFCAEISLVLAQLSGRVVWGAAMALAMGLSGEKFTFSAFLAGGFVNAAPGILLQWVIVPLFLRVYRRSRPQSTAE